MPYVEVEAQHEDPVDMEDTSHVVHTCLGEGVDHVEVEVE